MALNNTTATDPSGEYDDWIDLFNNSSSPISLNGYYLTDDARNLTQWAFPDTLIAPYDYLIVWADSDLAQKGLHANFKLSGDGEAILLVDTAQTVGDGVTFGPQTADISTARYPNGTPFIQMPHTFSAENDSELGVEDVPSQMQKKFVLQQNFPNPFTHSTNIRYHLPVKTEVSLKIYAITGRVVKILVNGEKAPGSYNINFDAKGLTAGIYFAMLSVVHHEVTKTLILL